MLGVMISWDCVVKIDVLLFPFFYHSFRSNPCFTLHPGRFTSTMWHCSGFLSNCFMSQLSHWELVTKNQKRKNENDSSHTSTFVLEIIASFHYYGYQGKINHRTLEAAATLRSSKNTISSPFPFTLLGVLDLSHRSVTCVMLKIMNLTEPEIFAL